MKRITKAISVLLVGICLAVSAILPVTAAASTTMYFSQKSLEIGGQITVTVRYSLPEAGYAIGGSLFYNSDLFEYVGSDSGTNNRGSYVTIAIPIEDSDISVSFTFRAKSAGSGSFELRNASWSDADLEMPIGGCSAAATVTDPAGSSSSGSSSSPGQTSSATPTDPTDGTDLRLTSISVAKGELTPAFSPDVREYRVTVPYEHTDGILYCKVKDPNAKISIVGERELKVGLTTRQIVVSSKSGKKNTYTVIFNRLDENGKDVSVPEEAITVEVEGKVYTVSTDLSGLQVPSSFKQTTVDYRGKTVPGFSDAAEKRVVLYLQSDDGTGGLFTYDAEKGFSRFLYLDTEVATYIFLEPPKDQQTPAGYFRTTYEFPSGKVTCWRYDDASYATYLIVYGVSPQGNTEYFRYDTAEKTIQRFPEFSGSVATVHETAPKNVFRAALLICLLIFIGLIFLAVVALSVVQIVRSVRRRKALRMAGNRPVSDEYEIAMESDDPQGIEPKWPEEMPENPQE